MRDLLVQAEGLHAVNHFHHVLSIAHELSAVTHDGEGSARERLRTRHERAVV
jgi:hypothetical protein